MESSLLTMKHKISLTKNNVQYLAQHILMLQMTDLSVAVSASVLEMSNAVKNFCLI